MQSIYIYFPDHAPLNGNSQTAQGKPNHAIEVLSFSHGVSMPLTFGSASGMSRAHGRANFQDFTISKYVDQTTPIFNAYCSGGNNLKKAVMEVWQAGQDNLSTAPVKFMTYTLENVIITSVSVGGSGGDLPTETITFNFGKIAWAYNTQDNKTGKGSADKTASWDIFENKAA